MDPSRNGHDISRDNICTRCGGAGRVPLFAGCGWAPCPRCWPLGPAAIHRETAPGEVVIVVGLNVRVTQIPAWLLDMASAADLTLDELLDRAQRLVREGGAS
jgi:hypothetical protein